MPNGARRTYQRAPTYGYEARASKTAKHSYMMFNFLGKNYKVHRLVCEAFHGPAPEGKSRVLHRDENSHNNVPDNLKWGTQKENLNASGFVEYCRSRTGENSSVVKGRKAKLQRVAR